MTTSKATAQDMYLAAARIYTRVFRGWVEKRTSSREEYERILEEYAQECAKNPWLKRMVDTVVAMAEEAEQCEPASTAE